MSIAFNSLRNIAVRSATVGFILVISVLTARLLGPEGSGVYALVTLYSSVGVALLGGMGTTAGYQISNQRRPVAEVVANVATLALMVGTAALGLLLLAWLVAAWAGNPLPWWVVIVGTAQPGLLLASALTWAFLGADDHRNYSYAILAPSLFTLLLMGGAMALIPHSTRAALLGWLLAQYAVIGWLWWRGRSVWIPLPLSSVTLRSIGALIGFSAWAGLANLISFLNLRADALLTERFLGTDQLGIYSKAVQLVEGLYFISQAVGVAIVARVGAASEADAGLLVARSIRWALTLMAGAGALLFLVADPLIPLLFGRDFAGAVTPFRVFIPGVVAWGAANILATFFTNQLGRPRVPMTIAAIALSISVTLCLVLIPAVGLAGGAIATTVSYTAAITVELVWFRRKTGLGWRSILVLTIDDLRDARHTLSTGLAFLRGDRPVAPAQTPEDPDGETVFRRVP